MKRTCWLFVLVITLLLALPTCLTAETRLEPVPFTAVKITDDFWQPRLETNRTVTVPHTLDYCESTGRLANFAKAAGLMKGDFQGKFYDDSDVYKVLEGAAYTLAQQRDTKLEARIDAIIDWIAAAQQPSGYLYTYYTLNTPQQRWRDLYAHHELYCAGHMYEAAVAYAQATGKTKFLDVAKRNADLVASLFGRGLRTGYPGHEEIELALVKLYRQTHEHRYADLARYFVDARGTSILCGGECFDPQYCQAHIPVRDQTDIVGHAVRAMYLYCGVADVAWLTGDPTLFHTMETIWNNVVHKKMYITGGVGARHEGEAFGGDYELPNTSAYCETCAAIGLALWNSRLLLLHGQARFADVLERSMYNNILAGVSMQGDTFFYTNPLASNGNHHRKPWYGTACCPTNIVRFIPSVGGYMYATSKDAIWVNLYIASTATIDTPHGAVSIEQQTNYPWSGRIELVIAPDTPRTFTLHLRHPGWCDQSTVKINGKPQPDVTITDGYVVLTRDWQPGDRVVFDMAMPVRRVAANPAVKADRGRVALQRGPIVYCLEAADNNGQAFNRIIPPDAKLHAKWRPDLLGGVVVVEADALAAASSNWENKLYQPVVAPNPTTITAVPYYAWDHREPGEMTVWIPESASSAGAPQ